MTIELTPAQLETLIQTLAEVGMQMDDDGRDGAFDASEIGKIYHQLMTAKYTQHGKAR